MTHLRSACLFRTRSSPCSSIFYSTQHCISSDNYHNTFILPKSHHSTSCIHSTITPRPQGNRIAPVADTAAFYQLSDLNSLLKSHPGYEPSRPSIDSSSVPICQFPSHLEGSKPASESPIGSPLVVLSTCIVKYLTTHPQRCLVNFLSSPTLIPTQSVIFTLPMYTAMLQFSPQL